MPWHEFRQAQTAIVSYYIEEQNNFSLLYETPILGKPWVSILLEVPIYEWSVVLLSRATHLPHYVAARTIPLACFYLALPALYLLLGLYFLFARFSDGSGRSSVLVWIMWKLMARSTHPNSDVWLRTPAHAAHITWVFGMIPDSYLREGYKTDGVEFLIIGETADGNRREIFRRLLDPVKNAADRGSQHEVIAYQPRPGEILQFSDRPNSNNAFDWTYWSKIEVK